MKTLRTAVLALTVALTVAGGTGAASHIDAKSPAGSSVVNTFKTGGSWCC